MTMMAVLSCSLSTASRVRCVASSGAGVALSGGYTGALFYMGTVKILAQLDSAVLGLVLF